MVANSIWFDLFLAAACADFFGLAQRELGLSSSGCRHSGNLNTSHQPALTAHQTIHFPHPINTEIVPMEPFHLITEDLVTDCPVRRFTGF
jgi:hypothetical protein